MARCAYWGGVTLSEQPCHRLCHRRRVGRSDRGIVGLICLYSRSLIVGLFSSYQRRVGRSDRRRVGGSDMRRVGAQAS